MDRTKLPFGIYCPPIGSIHVSHEASTVTKDSRYSAREVIDIATWLFDNLEYIKQTYSKINPFTRRIKFDMTSTVVIVTPFEAQRDLLRKTLEYVAYRHDFAGELGNIACLTLDELWARGKNSSILIFSPTYGSDDYWEYIRDNYNLIDKAFSWPKHYVFVFGESNDTHARWRKHLKGYLDKTYRSIPYQLDGNNLDRSLHQRYYIREMLLEWMKSDGYVVTDPSDRWIPGTLENLRMGISLYTNHL
jgi:hypothetical protein